MKATQPTVKKRQAEFASRTVTRIWQEDADPNNPYLAENCRCHGYDIMELAGKRSYVDVLFLLFLGELPTPNQAKLLESLMVALISCGPRHPATRSAMNVALSRTNTAHILPISLSVLSGKHLGGEEVVAAMRFLQEHLLDSPRQAAGKLTDNLHPAHGDVHVAPGFGSRFGSIDPLPQKIASALLKLPGRGKHLEWGSQFAEAIKPYYMGWLDCGVAAAVFCDLGLPPRSGAGLFQLLRAPGFLAHGLEMADKPITTMPFLDEEHYVIEEQARKR